MARKRPAPSKQASPTIPREQLGRQLVDLREAAGLDEEQVAEHLGCSDRKIRRIETGTQGIVRSELLAMLTLYGVADQDRRDEFVALQKLGQQRGWWTAYGPISRPYSMLIGYESAATTINNFELAVIPGLLQTANYARELLRAQGYFESDDEAIERRVELRLARQERLAGDDPVKFWAIIDESALLRPVGSPEIMREQFEHLLAMGNRPNVDLQIVPLAQGAHPATAFGSFRIMVFPEEIRSPIVYLENMAGDTYQEDAADVERCNVVFNHMRAAALNQRDSVRRLREGITNP